MKNLVWRRRLVTPFLEEHMNGERAPVGRGNPLQILKDPASLVDMGEDILLGESDGGVIVGPIAYVLQSYQCRPKLPQGVRRCRWNLAFLTSLP